MLVLNKNEETAILGLKRFKELETKGKTFKNILTKETFQWQDELEIPEEGAFLFTTKIN